jgi:hypothetical protein
MIQAFMATLEKDMKALTDNLASHEAALEELSYCRVISLCGQYKVLAAYIKDKGT